MSTVRFTFQIPIAARIESKSWVINTPYDLLTPEVIDKAWPLTDRWGWRMRPLKSRQKRAKFVRNVK